MDVHGEASNTKAGLLVVSDGSVIVHSMSHGWVIADKTGKILVSGAAQQHTAKGVLYGQKDTACLLRQCLWLSLGYIRVEKISVYYDYLIMKN